MIHLPVLLGGRWVGRVWRYQRTHVDTLFFHVWFIPLIPIGSRAVQASDVPGVALALRPQALSLASVVAAYLRVWPLIGGALMLASWWGAWWWYRKWDGGLGIAAIALGLAAVGWAVGARAPARHRAAMDEWLRSSSG